MGRAHAIDPDRSMTDLAPGASVGAYRIEAVVGRGTTGVVYRAVSGAESVALKVLRPELAIDEMYRRRFLREIRIAQELRHPHLVEVLDAGVDGETVFLVARYVHGRSLAALLREDGPLPMAQVVRTALGVAAGLDELHRQGIVHRDVKPSNILIDAQGRAAVTDFGLARHVAETVLTSYGLVLGTLDYIAPERLGGGEATPASDVYSLGCVVYACLTGRPPFAGRGIDQVMDAHRSEEPEDPTTARRNAPVALGWAVLRALAKDPALRPGTASAYARIVRAGAFEGDG
jgi:serine/threonine protein kinase